MADLRISCDISSYVELLGFYACRFFMPFSPFGFPTRFEF